MTFVALAFTGSRGGIVSFAASLFGYLFILYREKAIRLQAIFSIAMVVLMVSTMSLVLMPSTVKKMMLQRFDPTTSESVEDFSSGRLRIWRKSISLFAERPIFGHGYRTIEELMHARFHGEKKVAHNQYLNNLVEFGIIGCGLYILMFLKIFQRMWDYQRTIPDIWEKKLYISYIAGLIGYAVSMLFGNEGITHYIFWFYTAVFLRYGRLREIDRA